MAAHITDDIRPHGRPTFQIGESIYELFQTEDWDMDEIRELKRLSKGMAPGEVERRANDGDPDAWYAIWFLSIRRAIPHTTEAQFAAMLKGKPLVEIIRSIRMPDSDVQEMASPDPLAPPAEIVSEPETPADSSGKPTLLPSTLARAGARAS